MQDANCDLLCKALTMMNSFIGILAVCEEANTPLLSTRYEQNSTLSEWFDLLYLALTMMNTFIGILAVCKEANAMLLSTRYD